MEKQNEVKKLSDKDLEKVEKAKFAFEDTIHKAERKFYEKSQDLGQEEGTSIDGILEVLGRSLASSLLAIYLDQTQNVDHKPITNQEARAFLAATARAAQDIIIDQAHLLLVATGMLDQKSFEAYIGEEREKLQDVIEEALEKKSIKTNKGTVH